MGGKAGLEERFAQKRPGRDPDVGFGCPGGIPIEEASCNVMRAAGGETFTQGHP